MSQGAAQTGARGDNLIEVRNVSMRFRYQQVLRDIDLTIHRGETVCIIGESGCGKTVMLKLLIGLLHPTEGSVWFDGRDVASFDGKELVEDAPAVWFPVPDGRALRQPDGLRQRRFRPARAPHVRRGRTFAQIVTERLHEVGLPPEVEAKKPAELSGGQRKRVGLARALAIGPEVMLYDEPTTGLDPIMSDVINELILQTQQSMKTTGVVVTHDMKTVTKVADRVIMLYPLARLGPERFADPLRRSGGRPGTVARPPGRPVRPWRGGRTAPRNGPAAHRRFGEPRGHEPALTTSGPEIRG